MNEELKELLDFLIEIKNLFLKVFIKMVTVIIAITGLLFPIALDVIYLIIISKIPSTKLYIAIAVVVAILLLIFNIVFYSTLFDDNDDEE